MEKTLDEIIENFREICKEERKRFYTSDDSGIEHFTEKREKYQRVTGTSKCADR